MLLPFEIGPAYKPDRLDLARRLVEAQLEESARRGSIPGFVLGSHWRAWIALREGDAREAEADARAAYDVVPEVSWLRHFAASALIDVLVDRDQLAAAQAVLAEAGGAGEIPVDRSTDLLLSTRSHLRAALGDVAGALADQLESRRRHGDFTTPDPDFPGWVRLARLRLATGDTDAARQESEDALAWARTWGTPGHVSVRRWSLPLWSGGRRRARAAARGGRHARALAGPAGARPGSDGARCRAASPRRASGGAGAAASRAGPNCLGDGAPRPSP